MSTKITQLLLFVLFMCTMQTSYANDTFTIQDYVTEKFTDLEWNLDGNIRGSARNSTRNTFSNVISDNYSNNKSNNYSLRIGSSMKYWDETIDKSLYSFVAIGGSFNSTTSDSYRNREQFLSSRRTESDKNKYSKKNSSFSLLQSVIYKDYLKDDYFYSISFGGSVVYRFSLKNNNESETKNYNYINDSVFYFQNNSIQKNNKDFRSTIVSVDFTIGEGRKYVGKYAFTAHNVVKELQKEGLLLKKPNKQIMIGLTDILYQYANSHTIDSRIKKIEKFDAIYSYLLENKIVKESNHYGMLLVQDAFEMFQRESRRFGFSKSIGIGFTHKYNKFHETTNSKAEHLSYRYQANILSVIDTTQNNNVERQSYREDGREQLWKYAVVNISYGKPINMQWQIVATANGRLYFDSYESESIDIEKKYDLMAKIRTSYFYTSRTIWNSSVNYSLRRYKNSIEADIDERTQRDDSNWRFNIQTSLEYRLNIPTTLRGVISYTHKDDEKTNWVDTETYSESTSFNFSLSLIHYIY